MTVETHPDFLELDRWALGLRTPELDAHLRDCERCRAHVERVGTPLPLPASLQDRLERRRFTPFRVGMLSLSGVLSLAAMLALVGPTRQAATPDDGVKGSPSIAVYVKRGAAVSLWNGVGPVQPDDKLQLKVAADGFKYVSVGSPEDDGRVEWLYAGETDPENAFMLPTSWRVDDAPGSEQLTIVLSRRRPSSSELELAAHQQTRNESVWTTQLVLPKQVPEKP